MSQDCHTSLLSDIILENISSSTQVEGMVLHLMFVMVYGDPIFIDVETRLKPIIQGITVQFIAHLMGLFLVTYIAFL